MHLAVGSRIRVCAMLVLGLIPGFPKRQAGAVCGGVCGGVRSGLKGVPLIGRERMGWWQAGSGRSGPGAGSTSEHFVQQELLLLVRMRHPRERQPSRRCAIAKKQVSSSLSRTNQYAIIPLPSVIISALSVTMLSLSSERQLSSNVSLLS